ncbi:MAG: hypothetical protein JNM29_07585 [Candidatus Odyssella sp.]|nr:hypothetical protein [Candidatus Odyssella sp.]
MGASIQRLAGLWRGFGMARQFLLASAAVIVLGMAVIGYWQSHRIADSVTRNSALSTALYVESFVGPKIQSMAGNAGFQPEVQAELERLLRETPLGRRIVSFKVWARGGTVIYASRAALVGRKFVPGDKLRQAWSGTVAAEFDHLDEAEHEAERETGLPLLEIYVPIRQTYTDRVIAVVEFYENAEKLRADIFRAKLESWLMLGAVGIGAVAALFGVVAGASRTIQRQRTALQARIAELSDALSKNQELQQRLSRSSRRAAEINERYLRQIGSDLHDGPAQLLSLALLRLDALGAPAQAAGAAAPVLAEERKGVRSVLADALHEIRSVSIGLSLPELSLLTLSDTIREAVRAHEGRTGRRVTLSLAGLPATAPHVVKATAFRIVQEGLNNAARHGGAGPHEVGAACADGRLVITVDDAGPGFDRAAAGDAKRLGLVGLRERLETLGGSLTIDSAPGQGTKLAAVLPLEEGAAGDR